jgi:hypothetical protein
LAASISRFSRSEIDAIPELPSVAVESHATLPERLTRVLGRRRRCRFAGKEQSEARWVAFLHRLAPTKIEPNKC